MKTKYLIYASYIIILVFISLTVVFSLSNAQNQTKNNQHLQVIRNLSKLRFESKIDPSFDQVPKYYINLDRSKDRNNVMKEEIAKYSVKNIERFPAVDGRLLKNVNKGEINGYTYQVKNKIRFSCIGATLSHLLLIKKIYDLKLDYALIMEDDMHFSLAPYWEKSLQDLIKETPKDWELLYLTYSNYNPKNKQNVEIEHITRDVHGACAYLISKKGCQKLVNTFFKNNQIVLNVDDPTIDVDILSTANRYLATPGYFINQNPFHISTIEGDYTQGGLQNNLNIVNYYLKKKELQNEV